MTSINAGFDIFGHRALVQQALDEDIASGDITVRTVLGDHASTPAVARIVARAPGVIAGIAFAQLSYELLDSTITFEPHVSDGDAVQPGDRVFTATGPAGSLLTGERTALNFLGRLSGIATMAREFVDAARAGGSNAVQICDTRKTTPGWRALEKYASAIGGAKNHRVGLWDQVLIKENHLAAAGVSLGEAVRRAQQGTDDGTFIGAEAETLDQLRDALQAGADMVLLDNFAIPDGLAEAVEIRNAFADAHPDRPPVQLEASGGITLTTVAAAASSGVDRISVGAITHSAPVLDLSCLFDTAETGAVPARKETHP